MKREKDARINVEYTTIKEYFILFFTLAAFNGFHIWILEYFRESGFLETNVRIVINLLMIYVLFVAAVITALVAFFRQTTWSRPMRKLSEAARKIAGGDFSVRIEPLRKDGKKDYVEVIFDDFNKMAQELQNVEIMKNDFISNVSHEIKTPLSVIQGYATALQNEELSAEARREYLKTIIDATHNLSTLVSNILKLNKLENQEIVSESNPFNLGEQLRRCAAGFVEAWERKNIRFEAEIDDITVNYDENMLDIVWNNLLSNAVKFTNPGGCIFVKTREKDGKASVSIRDTGCGIGEETQKRIFDKFYQGDASHSQNGNGLGLALVKRIINLLGGTIDVESQPGQGTTFTVCLPVCPADKKI